MAIRHSKLVVSCFSLFLSFGIPLSAEVAEEETNAQVNVRPLPVDMISSLEAAEQTHLQVDGEEKSSKVVKKNVFDFFRRLSPLAQHQFFGISPSGYSIVFEDDSKWMTPVNEQRRISYWRPNDSLFLYATTSWKDAVANQQAYYYYILNESEGSTVQANLYEGPKVRAMHSIFVQTLGRESLQVTVKNSAGGSMGHDDVYSFFIHPDDAPLFQKWEMNDSIIMGAYDRWLTSYDCILINVESNHYVRAKKL